MFYTLHRLVKFFFILLALGCVVWLYRQRQALEPIWVWYDVYENGGIQKTEPLPVMTGEGKAVIDGHTFEMRSDAGLVAVRLTGFDVPQPPFSIDEIMLEKRRREFLRNAIVGKPIRVEVTYSAPRSVLGIVYSGRTNLNTYYVSSGLSHFNREYVKTTPRDLQYKFFAAARAKTDKYSLADARIDR
jgi:hypothetical protein